MAVAIDRAKRDTAGTLYHQGFKVDAISTQLGVSPNVIRKWAHRYGWNTAKTRANTVLVAVETHSRLSSQLANNGDHLREKFAKTLESQADALNEVPVKATVDHVQAVATAALTLIQGAKTVFDWGSGSKPGLVMAEFLGAEQQERSSVAIAAEVTQADCVSNTTIGCSVQSQPTESTPQDAQAVAAQQQPEQPQ